MATRNSLQALYGSAGTIFPDNTTGDISEGDMRGFGQAITASHFNLTDDAFTGAKGVNANINTITGLKTLVTVGVAVNVVVLFRDINNSDVLRVYQLVTGVNPEASPAIIRPNDYAAGTNEKLWALANAGSIGLTIRNLDTTTTPIDIAMGGLVEVMFKGSANIGGAKIWNITDDASSLFIPSVKFTITGIGAQSFPSNVKMPKFDANWNPATNEWTPPDTGIYEMSATRDGVDWLMKIQGPY